MAGNHILPWHSTSSIPERHRPVIGVLCSNRTLEGHAAQAVPMRFIEPLTTFGEMSVLLVPAVPGAVDTASFAGMLDALLLTGACSNIAASRYATVSHGGSSGDEERDEGRDEVALSLAGRMIERGRPVIGICRGLQELNVLFGGTLTPHVGSAGHHRVGDDLQLSELFDHHHDVEIFEGGLLGEAIGHGRHRVNSVHHQGIERLGAGLSIEARADDGLIEAVAAKPCGGQVIGVQWHPEWDAASQPGSRPFFEMLGAVVRGATLN